MSHRRNVVAVVLVGALAMAAVRAAAQQPDKAGQDHPMFSRMLAAIVAKGVGAARLSAVGFGQTKPITDNATDAGRAKNRRVELVKK